MDTDAQLKEIDRRVKELEAEAARIVSDTGIVTISFSRYRELRAKRDAYAKVLEIMAEVASEKS